MKGYLQRLVQTAKHPEKSVRPWVSSVFSAGRQHDFRPVESEESSRPVGVMPAHEVVSPESAEFSQLAFPIESPPNRTELEPTISESEAATFVGETRRSGQIEPRSESTLQERLIDRGERSIRKGGDAAEPAAISPQEFQGGKDDRVYKPLVRVAEIGKAVNLSTVPLPVSAGGAAIPTNPRAVRVPPAASRQTDEIQIHIGRIEVTAVHPPAPVAPKARDKDISLDSYLKRRDGRSR